MTLPISVQKLKNGLYRLLWHTSNSRGYRDSYSSFNYSSKVDLTSFGVDECYDIRCSANNNGNVSGPQNPSLKLTLMTSDDKNFKQRKLTATFLGYEKEMVFTSNSKEEIHGQRMKEYVRQKNSNKSSTGQASRPKRKITLTWTAEWAEITRMGCYNCNHRQGMAETFEVLIDMDPMDLLSAKEGQQSVLSHIAHLWESKTSADVTFKCEDKELKAHTLIVFSGSPVPAAMFQNDFKEKQEMITEIKETNADVFEKLLYFIYTGNLDYEFDDIPALYLAADMYNIALLKRECEKCLTQNITVENATTYLIFAHLYNANELHKATLNYMQKNSEAICSRPDWMSLYKNYPKLGFVAMQFMVKKNNVDQKSMPDPVVVRKPYYNDYDETMTNYYAGMFDDES